MQSSSSLTLPTYLTLFAAISVFSISCTSTASETEKVKHSLDLCDLVSDKDYSHGRGMEKMAHDMMTAFSLARNMMDMMLSMISPILQIKLFGISVVSLLMNVSRMVMDTDRMQKIREIHEWQKAIYLQTHHQFPSMPVPVKYYVTEPKPKYLISETENNEHSDLEQPTYHLTLKRLSNRRHGAVM